VSHTVWQECTVNRQSTQTQERIIQQQAYGYYLSIRAPQKVLAACFHPSTTKTKLDLIRAMSATRLSQMHRLLSCRYRR